MKRQSLLLLTFVLSLLNTNLEGKKTERLISLAPNVTETLYAIGAGHDLIANSTACDYPRAAIKQNKIGQYLYPNIEKILTLKPSLVIASQDNNFESLHALKATKTELFILQTKSLDTYLTSVLVLGKKIQRFKKAKLFVTSLKNSFKKTRNKKKSKSFSFLFFIHLNSFHVISKMSFIDEIFLINGFKNLINNTQIAYPMLQKEVLLELNPDFIFINPILGKNLEESYKISRRVLKSFLDEKRKTKIIILPKDIFLRMGPRILEASKFLGKVYNKHSIHKKERHL
jgi:iron complex transport system substrate-binding protein